MQRTITLGALGIMVASLFLLGVWPHLQTARSAGCSNDTLRGAYGYTGDGTFNGVPFAQLGVETFDGTGHVSTQDTANVNGNIVHRNFTASYAVSADCTGTLEYTLPGGTVRHVGLVIVDGGRRVYWMSTDGDSLLNGEQSRQ